MHARHIAILASAAALVAFACVPQYEFTQGDAGDGGPTGDAASDAGAVDGGPDVSSGADAGDAAAGLDAGLDAGEAGAPVVPARRLIMGTPSFSGHVCAFADSGTIYCWGDPGSDPVGMLGFVDDGGDRPHPVPVPASPNGEPSRVALGRDFSCALYGGVAWCRGDNTVYERGNPAVDAGPVETPVLAMPDAALALASGGYSSCAIAPVADAGGQTNVFCWGYNGDGELGRPTTGVVDPYRAFPLQADPEAGTFVSDAIDVAVADAHACVVTAGNQIFCWGDTDFLESGPANPGSSCDSNDPCTSVPRSIPVPSGEQAVQVALGDRHSCARMQSGNVYCWGSNEEARLGGGDASSTCPLDDAAASCSLAPLKVPGVANATWIAAGDDHTCALDTSGQVRCWGDNSEGQLGQGDVAAHAAPVVVDDDLGAPIVVVELAAGGDKSCARTADGTILCWGDGDLGTTPLDGGQAPSGLTPSAVVWVPGQ